MKEDKVQELFAAIQKLKPEEREQLEFRLKQAEKEKRLSGICRGFLIRLWNVSKVQAIP